jgi:hypothetical protein
MGLLIKQFLKNNQEAILNEFDYLFIYVHMFIIHHIPQQQVIRKLLFFKT